MQTEIEIITRFEHAFRAGDQATIDQLCDPGLVARNPAPDEEPTLAGFKQKVAGFGNPVFERRTLGNCGPDTELGGYTLLTAETLNEAVALVEGCPLLAEGGGVEAGTLTLLNSGLRADDR